MQRALYKLGFFCKILYYQKTNMSSLETDAVAKVAICDENKTDIKKNELETLQTKHSK